ncbi:MAG: YidB family protein [Wenzhouxiangella sp.]|jgi:uncharacterized protein YidB (DUF937 family)|nr:YidB family protein [Wenzhouxiangella sp.]
MDIQQILAIGAQAFQAQADKAQVGSLPLDQINGALAGLMPGEGAQVDLGALIEKMQNGGLASLAQTWLGDGGNDGIDISQLTSMFDSADIQRFADQLGLDQETALNGLQGAIPEMIDKASSGGSLDSLGGVSGVMAMAGKLFAR